MPPPPPHRCPSASPPPHAVTLSLPPPPPPLPAPAPSPTATTGTPPPSLRGTRALPASMRVTSVRSSTSEDDLKPCQVPPQRLPSAPRARLEDEREDEVVVLAVARPGPVWPKWPVWSVLPCRSRQACRPGWPVGGHRGAACPGHEGSVACA
ncbi:pistil-specific extensin-like protein [Penaeus monodon]|uniref:pistil-specific extensin-like protein n=1 Tax=Penaeus monodon TaxID=6687 RepID=UPI0018A72055|nr:pistil-specific extensin-like protein [Penaeus monodon]